MTTSLAQFSAALGNPIARRALGLSFSDAEAQWILADAETTAVYFRRWAEGHRTMPVRVPQDNPGVPIDVINGHVPPPPQSPPKAQAYWVMPAPVDHLETPGRRASLIWAIVAAGLLFPLTILAIPPAIAAVVCGARALNAIPNAAPGRGMALSGLILGASVFVLGLLAGAIAWYSTFA